jgi:hypothetical protein
MDRRERRQFARIERCLITMSSLGPNNPADMAAIVQAWRTSTQAASSLWNAIECLGTGRWSEADEHIADAENDLKAPPGQSR